LNPQLNEYGQWTNDFFEEPVLLMAFILLGRALEGRARAGERGFAFFKFATAVGCALSGA
jgi:hypothetical protein